MTVFVFYFAGHGQTHDLDNGGTREYIIPVEAGTSDYPKTAISMNQIKAITNRISARHILYVMDRAILVSASTDLQVFILQQPIT